METSTTRIFWCPGNRHSASGTVVIPAKGGGQFALEDTSSDGIRYLGGGVHCLSDVIEDVLVLRQEVPILM